MSNIRSEFGNLKGHQVETARNTIVIYNVPLRLKKYSKIY